MKIYKFLAECDRLTLAEKTSAGGFSGNRKTYRCEFSFSKDWENLSRFAVFVLTDKTYTAEISDGACDIPYEALLSAGIVHIGVFGSGGDGKILSTSLLPLYVSEGAYREGETPETPTPSVWEKYYAEITKVGGFADRAQSAAESAESAKNEAKQSASSASAAKEGAEAAKTAAENAKDGAETAKSGAESAQSGAEAAKTAAQGFSSAASESSAAAAKSAQDAEKSAQSAEAAKTAAESAKAEIEGKLSNYETHEEAAAAHEQLSNEMYQGFYPRTAIDNTFYTKTAVDQKCSEVSDTVETINYDLQTQMINKVDKEEGKGLSSNDYTDEDKQKVGEVANKADKSELLSLKQKSIPKNTASGYPATLTNALSDEALLGLKVYGNHGKNVLSFPFYGKTTTVNGVKFTDNNDGTITANGTAASKATYFVKFRKEFCPEKKKYALSGCPTGGGAAAYQLAIDVYNGETWVKNVADTGSGTVVNLSANTFTGASIYISIAAGVTVNNLVFKPQLEEGDAATEFEAYKAVGTFDSASGKYLLPVCLSVDGNPLMDCESTAYLSAPLDIGAYVDFIAKKRYSASGNATDITVTGEIKAQSDDSANVLISTTDVAPLKIEAEYFADINKELAALKAAILSQGGNV